MRRAIFIIILATTSSTFPITELDLKTNGKVIQLTKRSSWMKSDNSVDLDALHSHVESLYAKILRGIDNYERNTGMAHSLVVKGTGLSNSKKRAQAVGSAAALRNHGGFVWYGTITIGTPPKSFTVDIDTGSSDLFLPGLTCSGCLDHARWDPASSRTATAKGSTFKLKFDDGVIVSGQQYIDNVTIAGLSANVQTIGAATTYTTNMGFSPDGMLGLAFRSMSSYPASPLFETLVDESKVTEPVFSVKLTSDGGELYLGGKNGDLYEGEIIYTPVTEVGWWQVNIQKIRGDHQTILTDITAIIDTGSNLIVGDKSEVAYLHSTLGGKSVKRGYYSFPCNDFPTISFYFGGAATVQIPASILNLGPVRTGSFDCFSGIVGASPDGIWSLGAVFLKSIYTVFDFGNQQVGFAALVGSSRAISKR